MPKLCLERILSILITIQDLPYGEALVLENCIKFPRLKNYNKDEVIYHIKQLADTHLKVYRDKNEILAVVDLTITGHRLAHLMSQDYHIDELPWIESIWKLLDSSPRTLIEGSISVSNELPIHVRQYFQSNVQDLTSEFL